MKELNELLERWNVIKAKLAMTDKELKLIQGKQDELVTRFQVKLGKTKEQIHKILADL
jgi:hypothetical protein